MHNARGGWYVTLLLRVSFLCEIGLTALNCYGCIKDAQSGLAKGFEPCVEAGKHKKNQDCVSAVV